MSKIVEETSKQVGSFFHIMREHPTVLAVVVSNFILLGFLFYSGSATLAQRRETVDLIVKWQERSDQLMSACVSSEIMQMVLTALKRNGVNIRPEPEASPKQP